MSKSELVRPQREVVHYTRRLTAVERPIPSPPERKKRQSVMVGALHAFSYVLAGLLVLYVIAGILGAQVWPFL